MKNMEFDPGKALGAGIASLSREELCQLVIKLCARVKAEAGTRTYRGGIYPDNICVDAQGGVSIGLAREGGWTGQELQFLPPELFWNGVKGSFSDVYSLGLLLYYGVAKGRLPYEGSCPDPQQRRMSGEDFPPPRAAGRRLGQIIQKATRFNSEERYKNVEELQIMLEGLGENQYLKGENGAEAIFNKPSEELSDLEKIMVEIIEKGESEPLPEEPGEEPEAAPAGGEPTAAPDDGEVLRVYEPQHRSAFSSSAPAGAPRPGRQPIPILTEEKNPELAPVVPGGRSTPAVQYGVSARREKKIAEEVKKRRRRPAVVILVLCAILVVAALLGNALLRDLAWGTQGQAPIPTGPVEVPNAAPAASQAPAATQAPEAETDAGTGARYELVREDLSWTEARDACAAMGGHLAVISSEEEWTELIPLATERGIEHLWVGLYRDAGDLLTVTGEDEGSYIPWAEGEPSFTDSYDGAVEDYVMLTNNGTGWAYNDSRNDPVADYPDIYSGSIGFICEYEAGEN